MEIGGEIERKPSTLLQKKKKKKRCVEIFKPTIWLTSHRGK